MLKIVNLNQVPECIEPLARWHHAQWSHLYPGSSLEQRIDKMQAYLGNDFIPSTWVAIETEPGFTGPVPATRLIGSAAIIASDMETRMELGPWLASVYVKEAMRKHGAGSKLVQHVVAQAAMHDYGEIYLFTPDQQSFYAKRGWLPFEDLDYHGEQVSIMVRRP